MCLIWEGIQNCLFSQRRWYFLLVFIGNQAQLKSLTQWHKVWVFAGTHLGSWALGLTGRTVYVLVQDFILAVEHFLLSCSWSLIQWQLTKNRDSVLSFDLSRPLIWAVIDTATLAQTRSTRSGCEQGNQQRLEPIPSTLISSEMQRNWIKLEKTQQCFR